MYEQTEGEIVYPRAPISSDDKRVINVQSSVFIWLPAVYLSQRRSSSLTRPSPTSSTHRVAKDTPTVTGACVWHTCYSEQQPSAVQSCLLMAVEDLPGCDKWMHHNEPSCRIDDVVYPFVEMKFNYWTNNKMGEKIRQVRNLWSRTKGDIFLYLVLSFLRSIGLSPTGIRHLLFP